MQRPWPVASFHSTWCPQRFEYSGIHYKYTTCEISGSLCCVVEAFALLGCLWHGLVACYRRFGTIYLSHLQGPSSPRIWNLSRNVFIQPWPRNTPEERRSYKVYLSLCIFVSLYLLSKSLLLCNSHLLYRVYSTLGHNCRRWFPRSLWWKKFI